MGKTGRNFKTRYNEHIGDILVRCSKPKRGYEPHILNTGHEFGNTEDIIEVVEHQQNGSYLNTVEKYHLYNSNKMKQNLVPNDNLGEQTNPIFEGYVESDSPPPLNLTGYTRLVARSYVVCV
jgi:hypothetical protein